MAARGEEAVISHREAVCSLNELSTLLCFSLLEVLVDAVYTDTVCYII